MEPDSMKRNLGHVKEASGLIPGSVNALRGKHIFWVAGVSEG